MLALIGDASALRFFPENTVTSGCPCRFAASCAWKRFVALLRVARQGSDETPLQEFNIIKRHHTITSFAHGLLLLLLIDVRRLIIAVHLLSSGLSEALVYYRERRR